MTSFLREGMTSNSNSLVQLREHLSCSWGANGSVELLPPTLPPDVSRDGHQTCANQSTRIFGNVGKKFILSSDPYCELMQKPAAMFPAMWKGRNWSARKGNKVNVQEKRKESEQNGGQKWKEIVLVRAEFLVPGTLLMVWLFSSTFHGHSNTLPINSV